MRFFGQNIVDICHDMSCFVGNLQKTECSESSLPGRRRHYRIASAAPLMLCQQIPERVAKSNFADQSYKTISKSFNIHSSQRSQSSRFHLFQSKTPSWVALLFDVCFKIHMLSLAGKITRCDITSVAEKNAYLLLYSALSKPTMHFHQRNGRCVGEPWTTRPGVLRSVWSGSDRSEDGVRGFGLRVRVSLWERQ